MIVSESHVPPAKRELLPVQREFAELKQRRARFDRNRSPESLSLSSWHTEDIDWFHPSS